MFVDESDWLFVFHYSKSMEFKEMCSIPLLTWFSGITIAVELFLNIVEIQNEWSC